MTNIPTPFVGGTDSPRRSSAEEMALEPPYTPGGGAAEEAGVAEPGIADQRGTERAIQVEVSDLDEEDLLPDMAAEAEEIAIEGPTYDLEWPEETEPEAPADLGGISGSAPVVAEPPVAEPRKAQPVDSNMEMPDFLLGPDSGEAELAAEPIGEETALSTDQLAELALRLQEGTHGESIQDLVAELSVHKPEIAVPRAFAAGYLAAKKEEEEE